MSGFGGIAGGVAGAIAGYYLSGGNPYGAMLGWSLGYTAGNLIDPQRTHGPTKTDLHIQGSTLGWPITVLWPGDGVRCTGNIIDKPDKFTPHEDSGGKGGPSVTTTSYSCDWLQILLGELGDPTRAVSLGRVWVNGELKDDYRAASTVIEHLPLVFYDGNEEQQPDPTLEAHYGVGNVHAYQNVLTVVFTNLDLSEWGGMIPQFEFELIGGVPSIEAAVTTPILNQDTGYSWPLDVSQFMSDPPLPTITKFPLPGSGQNIRVRQCNSNTVRLYDCDDGSYIGTAGAGADDAYPEDANIGIGFGVYQWPIGVYRYDDNTTTKLWTSYGDPFIRSNIMANGVVVPVITSVPYFISGGELHGVNFGEAAGLPVGHHLTAFAISQDGRVLIVITVDPSNNAWWYRVRNGLADGHGPTEIGFGIANYPTVGRTTVLLNPFVFAVENNGRFLWSGSTFSNNRFYGVSHIDDDGVLRARTQSPGIHPATSSSAQTSLVTLAREGYAATVYDDEIILMTRLGPRGAGNLFLSEVVSSVSDRCGLVAAQYEVSDIEIPVRGFMVDQVPITGRATIETLLPVYFCDAYDNSGVATFIKRGRQPDVTVPSGDVAAHSEDDGPPARLQTVIAKESELPAHLIYNYINPATDFQGGSQPWRRQTGGAKDARSISVAVVQTDAEAKRTVEVWGESFWAEADAHSFQTSWKYIKYTPTSVMVVEGVPIRITKQHIGILGRIEFEGVLNDPTLLEVAAVAADSGGGFVPPTIAEPQDTELVIIDGPFPEEGHEGIIKVAMCGALRREWKGARLYKSTDGGVTYTQVLMSADPATIGEALTVLPNFGGGNMLDTLSHANVLIHPGGGDLVSVTREQAEAGANLFMWGSEALAVLDAELIASDDSGKTYAVKRFLRGLHGTEKMMAGHTGQSGSPSTPGDTVVLMSTALTIEAVYSEYGQTVLYKAVTLGRSLASATAVSFRSNGVSRAPWAPVHLGIGMGYDGADRFFRMRWMERMRLNNAWLDLVDLPRDEAVEKYRVQIWEDGSYQTVVREIVVVAGTDFTSGDPYAKYTDVMQTADFGAPFDSPSQVSWTVAKWGVLGWGYDSLGRLPLIVPDTTSGYVPPNPPPADGHLSVMPWVSPTRILSGAFGANDQWHIQVTTGHTSTPAYGPGVTLPRISGAEYLGSPCPREWCLSLVRGDFVGDGQPGSKGSGGPSIGTYFALGTGTGGGFYPVLELNTTYYLNVRNLPATEEDREMFCDLGNIAAYP